PVLPERGGLQRRADDRVDQHEDLARLRLQLHRRRERRELEHDRRHRPAYREVRRARVLRAEERGAVMTSSRKPGKAEADIGRRSFFWKLGAGVSAALASATAAGRAASGDGVDAALRAAMLEEEQALRRVHRNFEQALDAGRYDDAVE